MYQFLGHCDLDLISRIIVSGAYEGGIPNLVLDASLDADMSGTIFRSL